MEHRCTDEPTKVWSDVEALTSEIASLAKSDISVDDFFASLLQRTAPVIGAAGGAAWIVDANGQLRLQTAVNGPDCGFDVANAAKIHGDLCQKVMQSSQAQVRESTLGAANGSGSGGMQLFAAPLSVYDSPAGLLEFVVGSSSSPVSRQGCLQLIRVVAELAGDFLRRRELGKLRDLATSHKLEAEVFQRLHRQLDLRKTAFEIVNEARRFTQYDRVSLAILHGSRLRVVAISGVDTLEVRSRAVRSIKRLCKQVVRYGSLFVSDSIDGTPSRLQKAYANFQRVNKSTSLVAIPLTAGHRDVARDRHGNIGVLLAEEYEEGSGQADFERLSRIAAHSSVALTNSLRFSGVPFAAAQSYLGRARRLPLKALAACLLLAGALAALTLVETDFDVRVEGELQPEIRREVFAPTDSQLRRLQVRYDQDVEIGDPILELDSPSLALEFERVQGEYELTVRRLTAIQAARVQLELGTDEAASRSQQLTAEEEELKQQRLTQQRELDMLRQERQRLDVRAPIRGRIATWDLKRRLKDRPVQRGQSLLTIANVDGPWIAKLWVPERKIMWVMQAHRKNADGLPVSYALASNPELQGTGYLTEAAWRADLGDDGLPGVWLTVNVDSDNELPRRPGTRIIAKIHCGSRTLGYTWFGGLYERIRGWAVF